MDGVALFLSFLYCRNHLIVSGVLTMESQLNGEIQQALLNMLKELASEQQKEWMSLKEAAEYAGVSLNTLSKFRLKGLKVFEFNGVKRVSKVTLDNFLHEHAF